MAALTDGTNTLPQTKTDFVQPVGSKFSAPGYAAPTAAQPAPVKPATAFSSVSGQDVLNAKQATAAKLTPGGVPSYMQNLSPEQFSKITGKAPPVPLTPDQLATQNKPTSTTKLPEGWDAATYASFKTANPTLEPTPDDTARMQAAGGSTPSNVTFVNKDTGQEYTLNNASADQIKNFQDNGWDLAEGSGTGAGVVPTPAVDPQVKAAQDLATQAKADRDTAVEKITNFDVSNDPALASIKNGIIKEWDSRIQQMQQVNTSRVQNISTLGIRLGDRYTGGSGGMFGGVISAEEVASANRINDLQNQRDKALADATSAYEDKQWTKYSKLVDVAENAYKDQTTELQNLRTNVTTQSNNLATQKRNAQTDYYNQVQKPINDIATEAAKNGLSDPKTLAAIQGAPDLGTAIATAGDYLQSGTGVVGEYLYYKRQAAASGQQPVDFNTYQTIDANRKAKANATAGDMGSLPAGFQAAAQAGKTGTDLLNSLDPTTKATLSSILDYTKNPTNLSLRKAAGDTQSEREKFLAMAHLIDPNYDESQFAARATYNKNLQSGAIYNGLQAAGKSINHLSLLLDSMSKIGNTGVSLGIPFTGISLNSLKADTMKTLDPGTQAAVKKASIEGQGVAQELAKFFKGTGVSDVGSIDEWSKGLNIFATPAEQQGVRDAAMSLLTGQLDVVYNSYANTMGHPPEKPLIPQDTLDKLKSMGIDTSPYEGTPLDTNTADSLLSQGANDPLQLGGGSTSANNPLGI